MKKIYFASDFHLGVNAAGTSKQREKDVAAWMDEIADDASDLFLLGDVFDFWFEYKTVIPKGYSLLFSKLRKLADKGVNLHYFKGNHDLWLLDYFEDEFEMKIYSDPQVFQLLGKKFYIGHGDGLGPGDKGYKRLKRLFRSPLSQYAYRWLHPDIGIRLAGFFSHKSRAAQSHEEIFLGPDKEWLIQYAERKSQTLEVDYFVFGHRHLPINYLLDNGRCRYINLGDWMSFRSFGVFDGDHMEIQFYKNEMGKIYS